MNPAKVSILIPCFNARQWVAQAIESALAQTWPNKEVVVVDDGSTDGSLEIIKRYDGRIRWETWPNRGGNPTRNRLLELSTGEWLQYLDADDYLLPEKISKQMDFLTTHPQTDIVFSPVTLDHWSECGSQLEAKPIPKPHDPWILLARWHLPQTGAPLWRKQAVSEVGAWKNDQPCCQEHELYLRLLVAGKTFAYCPADGAIYRQWNPTSVCRKNLPELHKQTLIIVDQAGDALKAKGNMTQERLQAINQMRFHICRCIWQYDRKRALEVFAAIKLEQPDFVPESNGGLFDYQILFRIFGFPMAEKIRSGLKNCWPR